MIFKDYYGILGLSPDATEAGIKARYRELAKHYHPDRNMDHPSSEEKFKDINEAYQVLGNKGKKSVYDWLLRLEKGHFPFTGAPFPTADMDLESLLGKFMSMGFNRGRGRGCGGKGFVRGMCGRGRRR